MKFIFPFLLLVCACGEDEEPFVSARKDAAADAPSPTGDAGAPAADAADPGRPPPDSGAVSGAFVVIHDLGEPGVIETARSGADIDALEWSCPNRTSGFAVSAVAQRTEAVEAEPLESALGPQDCDQVGECSVPLGVGGVLVLETEAESLNGCILNIFEITEDGEEPYEVYVCPRAEWAGCGPRVGHSPLGGELEVLVP